MGKRLPDLKFAVRKEAEDSLKKSGKRLKILMPMKKGPDSTLEKILDKSTGYLMFEES